MEVAIEPHKLDLMKYAELRKLAKTVGIKANMKADKLVKALQEYAATQNKDTGRVSVPSATTVKDASGTPSQLQKVATTKLGTPLGRSLLQGSPRPRLSSGKPHTPLHRLRTPPSRRNSSARRSITVGPQTPLGQSPQLPPAKKSAGTPSGQPQIVKGRKRTRSVDAKDDDAQFIKKQKQDTSNLEDIPRRRSRSRTNTYELDESNLTSPKVSSPGTKEMIDSMRESLTENEMKEQLMAALDKKVQNKLGDKPLTQIPRFVAFCALKKEQERSAPITPGQQRYKKVHEKNFEKMDSLDQYLEKRKKRTEQLTGSAQKVRFLAEQTSSALKKLKSITADTPQACSPKKTTAKAELFKSPHPGIPFVPKETSVSKVSFNFGSRKTPNSSVKGTRTSPRLAGESKENTELPARRQTPAATSTTRAKSMGGTGESQKPKITPFKSKAELNQSLNLNKSTQKAKFNIQASLARPLTYKPYTGKLKPLATDKVHSHRCDVKAVKVSTREERRQKVRTHQAAKRDSAQMKRRGLAQ